MILYKLNNTNRISWWRIEQDVDEHNNLLSGYTISWGQDLRTTGPTRNNNHYPTTTPERAADEIVSHINHQIDRKGYSKEIPTTVPDLPMLAQKWEEHSNKNRQPWKSAFLQPKLDGVRCLATKDKMTSRRLDIINSCPHIQYLLEHLQDDYKLDGELYIHNVDLQTTQSYVDRHRPHKLYKEIEYHVYDLVDSEMPFRERWQVLRNVTKELMIIHSDLLATYKSIPEKLRTQSVLSDNCPIKLVTTTHVDCPTNSPDFQNILNLFHKDAVEVGYEGAIIRNPESVYDLNYRSPNLLKFKHRMDAEFEVIDISEGYNKTGIFVCKTASGGIFEATPSWTVDKKRHLLRNKENYIGCWVTVEFEKYSRDGLPLKTSAKCTRKIEPEPSNAFEELL